MDDRRIEIFAHRGAEHKEFGENNLGAFGAAAGMPGCDGIELDVRLTRDGRLVVSHGEYINFSGRKIKISRFSLPELVQSGIVLDELKFSEGCWRKPPSLSLVLRQYLGQMPLNIELKDKGSATALVKLLSGEFHERQSAISPKTIIVSSFLFEELVRFRHIFDVVDLRFLLCGASAAFYWPMFVLAKKMRENHVSGIHLEKDIAHANPVNYFRQRGFRIGVYTVNTDEDFLRLAQAGVDMIFTDELAKMIAASRVFRI